MSGIYTIPRIVSGDDLATLVNCRAFYARPIVDGKAHGPLVAYHGTYAGPDGKQLRYVGDAFVNFAQAEQFPTILTYFASRLTDLMEARISTVSEFYNSPIAEGSLVLVGMPIAAYMLTTEVGRHIGCRTIFFEKKTIEIGVNGEKDKTKLIQGRHQVLPGEKVILVEELVNNVSTASEAMKVSESTGGEVVAIVCAVNRSYPFRNVFETEDGRKIPIIAVIEKSFEQYRQDAPEVAEDVRTGNISWDPKKEWQRLKEAMDEYA
ncbi:MAG: hypothetical protein WCJ25_01835 [Candidatus Moraniibacteriota bacterium]